MTVLGWDDSHPADKQSSNDKCEGSVAGAGDVGATVKCCPFVQERSSTYLHLRTTMCVRPPPL